MNSIHSLNGCRRPSASQGLLARVRPGLQSGFSLIELMVAVLIGLFLTLGLSQIFLSMYSTSQSQNKLGQAQENQRLGVVMLANTVQLAGFYAGKPTSATANVLALPQLATNNTDGSSFTAGAGIVGIGGGSGTGAKSDSVNIYFQSGGVDQDGIINCQGGTAPASTLTTFVNSFYINSSWQLVCSVTTNNGKPNTPLVLANDVYSMSILYGVDSVLSGTTDTYLTATDVQTNGKWLNVRSIQITLNFFTPNLLNPNAAYTSTSPTTPWVQTISLMSKS
ncbi:PilW family protein [Sapientia aquatica]|uniref:Prepilin-type N-terminal cleavage/methylation domain-containing protein n=1 Tax=Sapientia aquatica TaxID=1549640 RepID=A0A4R5W536_9BURK|nr:PilW family protein [Sapientia aquatica]TDK68020.1 prepilin-type N-terminal cleavage/methylation domain-containing protein [Sapientia aquatica]